MLNRFFIFISVSLLSVTSWAQDSIKELPEVLVCTPQSSDRVISLDREEITTISRVNDITIRQQHGLSLVPAANALPGVRMEERSPGSYRLSMRGSLLRSPFGIRNIKLYLDDLPFTNASGETYLNLIDPLAFTSMDFLRGPNGGIYGQNSGGVIIFNTVDNHRTDDLINLSLAGGSYGMMQENLLLRKKNGKHVFNFRQGYQQSDGYRDHSAMNRKFFQVSDKYSYSNRGNVRAVFLFSDLLMKLPEV
jgi:iron complex outermembrane receptor protein